MHMSVPKFHEFMLPIVKELSKNRDSICVKDLTPILANHFNLSSEDRLTHIASGRTKFHDRISWALTYLKQSGLIESKQRSHYQITDFGMQELPFLKQLDEITVKYLKKYPLFVQFTNKTSKPKTDFKNKYVDSHEVDFKNKSADNHKTDLKQQAEFDDQDALDKQTPTESFEDSFNKIKENVKSDLLDQINSSSPVFFEKLVVDLLQNLGYSNFKKQEKRQHTSRDEGIDGTIHEDKLGLNQFHIQAKRWGKAHIGRPEIQKFVGALEGKKSKKGVFITTSVFTKDAKNYVKHLNVKVILIDGNKLADLMFESGTALITESVYKVKKINEDYFENDITNTVNEPDDDTSKKAS